MTRLQLFEWENLSWLPRALRDFITHHLQYTFSVPPTQPLREAVVDILAPPLKRSGETHIIDVCSGGGGPLIAVLPNLASRLGMRITARLTDLFPNVDAFAAIERGYPIPVAPLILSWDGLVSCLRAYTPDELLTMAQAVAPHYKWEAGERAVALPRMTLTLTWLIGEPATAA